jgi:hypothetical protein
MEGAGMASGMLMSTAEKLVAYWREGKTAQGLEEFYHPDVVSVEAVDGGQGRETRGLDALRAKHAWWGDNFIVHGGEVHGPFPHGEDRFAVVFDTDAEQKSDGMRWTMREVAVYHVDGDGRVVREEFFYRNG